MLGMQTVYPLHTHWARRHFNCSHCFTIQIHKSMDLRWFMPFLAGLKKVKLKILRLSSQMSSFRTKLRVNRDLRIEMWTPTKFTKEFVPSKCSLSVPMVSKTNCGWDRQPFNDLSMIIFCCKKPTKFEQGLDPIC